MKRLWLVVVAPFVVFIEGLTGSRLLAPFDGYQHYLPLHVLAARMARAGHLPTWNPYTFSGYPLLGSGQAGVFYPPNWLFLAVPAVAANNLVVVFDFVVAGVGAFLLVRHLCDDAGAALVSGLAFSFSGFMFAHVTHQSLLASASWLPWSLYGYELLRARWSVGRLALGSFAVALSALAGHGQLFAVVVATVALYAIVLAATGGTPSERGRALAAAGATLGVGAALGAVQLLPTAAIVGSTSRASLDYATATTYSLPLSHTPLLVFPYLFGNASPAGPFRALYTGAWSLREITGYPGAAVLVLAAAGVVAGRRDRRPLALVVVAAVAFVAALGRATPIGHVVYAVPLAGQFRAWGRYLVVVDLALAVLAGYGAAALRRSQLARRAALAAAAVIVLAAVVVPYLPRVHPFAVHGGTRVWALLIPAGAAAVASGLCMAAGRHAAFAAGALAVLVAVELVLGFGEFAEWRGASPSPGTIRALLDGRKPPAVGDVPHAAGGIVRYLDVGGGGPAILDGVDLAAVRRLRSANGFDPLAPRQYTEAVGGMSYFGAVTRPDDVLRPGASVLDLLRISLVVAHGTEGERRVARTPALPDAFVVGRAQRVGRAQALAALHGVSPFDPATTVLLDHQCEACAGAETAGVAGTATAHFGEASVDVDVDAARPAVVIVSQAYFPGWHATVDGRAAPVVRADALVEGVPVASGRHVVRLRYRPPGLELGAGVSAAAAAALAMAAALSGAQRRGRAG